MTQWVRFEARALEERADAVHVALVCKRFHKTRDLWVPKKFVRWVGTEIELPHWLARQRQLLVGYP